MEIADRCSLSDLQAMRKVFLEAFSKTCTNRFFEVSIKRNASISEEISIFAIFVIAKIKLKRQTLYTFLDFEIEESVEKAVREICTASRRPSISG